jgi:general secretion pathway protein K
VSPLSLLTFFAAAKKVSAAPHRGNANKPIRIETPNAVGTTKTMPPLINLNEVHAP